MCLEEYDEAFHIASEKEISFEEGRLEGLKSAEKERLRAEKERLRAEALDLRVSVLARKLRGESEKEIAENQGIALDEVQKILEEI